MPYLEAESCPARSCARGEYYWHEVDRHAGPRRSMARTWARSTTSTGPAERRCSSSAAGRRRVRPAGRPGVHPDLRAAARRDRGRRRRAGARAPEGAPDPRRSAARPALRPGERRPTRRATTRSRRRREPNRRRRRAASADAPRDPRDRRPDALPGHARRARCRESIPGRIQERGLATVRVHDLRDVGSRPSSQRRRLHLRRGSGDGAAARAGRGRARRPAPARTRR